ncbi:MAG: ABC transporter ATP-binding protein [Chloroflexi bacterium]|nr:ABC transporter ATP-binding protein [Chloroflexota bacterium]
MIEIQDVWKVHRLGQVEVPALRGVSLTVERGEMVAIMGPSGSGKSTLMNLVGCLDVPTRGTYRLDDRDVGRLSDDRLAVIRSRQIGFIFQTYHLLPRLSALQNVEMPLLYGNGHDRKQRALAALERVGLAGRMHHRPAQLSGGEQQRVGIARALVKRPTLLLADEPTGNLDTKSSDGILHVLQELNSQEGITILLVTHEPDVAARCRRVVALRDGVIVSDGPSVPVRSPAVTGAAS